MCRNVTSLASRVVLRVTGHLSTCVWKLQVFLDDAWGFQSPFVLNLHPLVAFEEVSGNRIPIKSRLGNRGLSSCGTTHEALSQIPSSDRPVKVGSHFQTNQGNRPSCRDKEERSGPDEVVPGTSVFPSSETSMSENFWGRLKGVKYRFKLQDGTWDFS